MKKLNLLIFFLLFFTHAISPYRLNAQVNCPVPTGLTVAATTQNSVTLNWSATNFSGVFNVKYQLAGTVNLVSLNNVSSPLTINGLSCNSIYVLQLQQVCNSTGGVVPILSPWTTITFNTQACPTSVCEPPLGVVATNITQTSAVLNWNQNSPAYGVFNLQYHSATSDTWITVNNVTSPYTLGNLTCGSGYAWRVQRVCTTVNSTSPVVSPWSTITFSTQACPTVCEAPAGVVATNITQTSAVIGGTPNTPNSLYNIQFHGPNTPNWTTVNNVTLPYQLGNLTCGVIYEWRVQRVCSNATGTTPTLSAWTTTRVFTTIPCQTVCESPAGLSTTNITQTSAVLSWNQNSPASGVFNLQYHSATSDTWITINNVTSPYTLGNLTCGSGYAWRVQRVCTTVNSTSPVVSPWSTITFSTQVCPTAVCEPPLGVVATNITQTSAVIGGTPNTPNSLYNIQFHGPNTPNWTTVNNVTLPFQLGNLTCGIIYEWRVQRVCSNAAGTTPTLSAWTTTRVFTTTSCQTVCEAPAGLSTTNITQTSAVLSWNPNSPASGAFNLQYHSATSDTWITINNVTSPYTLGNLTCGSGYAWRVQRVCNQTISTAPVVSPWSTITFSTQVCPTAVCEPPLGVVATNITQTSAVIGGTPNTPNSLYNIQFHGPNTSNWTTVNNVSLPFQLGNLTCGVIYEWRVQRICSNATGTTPTLSAWTTTRVFTTTPCQTVCEAPAGLSTTNITQTSAVLSWNQNSPASGAFNLQYHSATSDTWITVNNVTSPYTLGNLTCGSGYAWRVQRVCTTVNSTSPVVSPWSTITFSTQACPTVCEAPAGVVATNITQTSAVIGGTPNTANSLYNIQFHGPNTPNWTTVNNVTLPYQLGNLTCGVIYEWRVQRVCSNATGTTPTLSAWTTTRVFTTIPCQTVCESPAGLSTTNITQTSAVLSWNQNSPASGVFNLQYHSATSDTWITINNVTSPYTLGNLTCGSGYAWRIQRVCNQTISTTPVVSPWSTITFSTQVCPTTVCEAPAGVVASNITQTSAVIGGTPNTANSLYNIQFHGPNTANWTLVNNVTLPYQLGNLTCGVIYEWRVQRVCSNAAGTTPTLSAWTTTRVFTTTPCQTVCEAPAGLSTTNITQTSAVLSWNPNSPASGAFNLQYHSATSDTWITVNNVTSPYTLGNLTCGSGYAWRVQRVCTTVNSTSPVVSPWSTITFSTQVCPTAACEPPAGVVATNITQTSAVIGGTPNTPNSLYNIQFHGPNTPNWTTVNNVTLPYQLGNLTCGVIYEWRVQRVCSNATGTTTTLSAWTTTRVFTTIPCQTVCLAPIGLSTTNITQTSAVLTWGIVSNAVSYVVYYKKANTTSAMTTVTTNTNSLAINGLTAATAYVFQVKAICGNGTIATNISPISVSQVFNTNNSFVIFPNPANSNFRIAYFATISSPIKIELRNNYGQLITNINNITIIGNNEFNINTDGISEGLYFLSIKTISDTIISKVIIKH